MSHASSVTGGMPPTRRATLRSVRETATTPRDLLEALLTEEDFATVADVARASGWNYQRLQRWWKGSVGDIPPDDMADLVVSLGRHPDDYGIRPSIPWRRSFEASDPGAAPAWFERWAAEQAAKLEQQEAAIRELRDLLKEIARAVNR